MLDPELSCEEALLHFNLANLISEELYFLFCALKTRQTQLSPGKA